MDSTKMNVSTVLQCKKCGKSASNPIVLNCCHIFCKQCLETDTKATQIFCPVCQRDEPISGDTGDLNTNLQTCITTVSKLLDKGGCGGVTPCCICGLLNVDVRATHQCLDCGDTLCEACRKGHQSSSVTHAHQVVDIDGVRNGKYIVKVKKSLPCHQHSSKKYEFYCETCAALLCATCLVFQHLDHAVISLEEAGGKYRSRLQDLSNKMEQMQNGSVKLSRDMLSQHRKTIEEAERTAVSSVREKTQSLIDQIRKHEQDIVDQITKLSQHEQSYFDLEEKKLRKAGETCALSVTLTKGVLHEGTDEELIMLFDAMRKSLDSERITMSKMEHAKLVSSLKTPVFTVEYNFPKVHSSMYTLRETCSAKSGKQTVPRTVTDDSQSDNKQVKLTDVFLEQPPAEHQQLKDASSSIPCDSTEHNPSPPMFDDGKTKYLHEEDVFKVTESLSIVGEFCRSVALNETTTSGDSHVDEITIQDRSGKSAARSGDVNEILPDVITGPLDCKLPPLNAPLSRRGPCGKLNKRMSKSDTNLFTGSYSLPKLGNQKTLCLIKHGSIHLRVSKDIEDPVIVGLCRSGDQKFVLLDNGNKKVRLVHDSGRLDSVNHPNKLTDCLSPHSVCKTQDSIVYISGTTVCITDGALNLKQTFKLDILENAEVPMILPLCKYDDKTFLIGNLPGKRIRLYSVSGELLDERQCPVEGPIAAINCNKDGHLLYSSWKQPGAVYQIRKSNQKVKTYRPPGVDIWYPEGSCVDMENNVYIANQKQNQIHVFRSNGSQLLVHSAADVLAPRYLVLLSNNTLVVSGDKPDLQTFKCTYSVKA